MEVSVGRASASLSGTLVAPQGWMMTLLICCAVGSFLMKAESWKEIKHTRALPGLIVLDGNISVGFEI